MSNSPDLWAEWEVDPSTRTSIHLWTKYLPILETVTTSATTLFTVDRGTPAVNLVTNPSFEAADLTMFTEIGVGVAPPDAASLVAVSGDGEISAPTYAANGIAGGATVVKVSAAANGADGSNGFYWTTSNLGGDGQFGSTIIGSVFVSGEQSATALGSVKMVIYDSSGTVLATGSTITLSQAWQRASVKYFLSHSKAPAQYRVGLVAASAFNMSTSPYYVDGFMVEHKQGGNVGDYTDGAQALANGATHEWLGAANASVSRKRMGISHIRGIRIVNEHATNPVYLCIDTDASTTNGIKIAGTETFETNWPIDAKTKITAIATGGSAVVHGVIWGVHQG